MKYKYQRGFGACHRPIRPDLIDWEKKALQYQADAEGRLALGQDAEEASAEWGEAIVQTILTMLSPLWNRRSWKDPLQLITDILQVSNRVNKSWRENTMSAKEQHYQFCATNMLTHNTKSVIMALKEKENSIFVEACLNACGDCRKGAFCITNKAQIAFTSLTDLENKVEKKTAL